MAETAITTNSLEAQRLYQRGVAAARGGQKRMAVGLLTRSVQLDPQHEAAWLWLSGVLDDPHQIAFCLQAVLRINPTNERAQRGLRWLEDRKMLERTPQPAPAITLPTVPTAPAEPRRLSPHVPQPPAPPAAQHEEWWMRWRHVRRDTSKVRLLLPSMIIVLLVSILFLHGSLVRGQEDFRQRQFAAETAEAIVHLPTAAVGVSAALAPSSAPILSGDTSTTRDAASVYYLSALTPLRQQLRDAVDNYRNVSGQPGASSVGLAAAVRKVHDQVEQAQTSLKRLDPPSTLRPAHEEYLAGLDAELQGWQSLLDFYGSYKAELANQAALHFQESNSHFDRARLIFDQQPQRLELVSRMSGNTPR